MILLHARHGNLVRTGPDEVSVSDLPAIKKIYGPGTKFRKSDWYSIWQGKRKFDLFAERDEGVHGQQRSLVSGIYSMRNVSQYEDKVDECISVFATEIEKRFNSVMDLGNWLQLFAFDIVGGITFSNRFGFLEASHDDRTFKNIEAVLFSGAWVGQMPWIFRLNDVFTPFLGNHLGVALRHGAIRQFAANQVMEREGKSGECDDLSDLYKAHQQKPDEMDGMAVLSMATSNIFAGSDTTAISLRSIIYRLLKNQETKKKLLEEIDDHVREGRFSDPVTLEEASQMPYLQACIYEGLRLHPAVGMSLPRVVPEGGTEIDGHYLPAGTIVGANPWVVNRDQTIYGDDVEAYRPERWLEGNRSNMDRYFFAFGGGARMCLGRNISWMEMSKLIPTLFRSLTFSLLTMKRIWRRRACSL